MWSLPPWPKVHPLSEFVICLVQLARGQQKGNKWLIQTKSNMLKQSRIRRSNLGSIFDEHVRHEFIDHDVNATMRTMVRRPIVHHVPTLTGGVGYRNVYSFYKRDFIGHMPNDTKIKQISRTIGKDQVVDELILSFTHDREIKFMLPGVPPTGKYIELPHVVVMRFKDNKIVHEHIYWDQASALAQIGILDTKKLPVVGLKQSRRLQEISGFKKIKKRYGRRRVE
jgi:carboxymethylenebutenolidase